MPAQGYVYGKTKYWHTLPSYKDLKEELSNPSAITKIIFLPSKTMKSSEIST